LGDRKHWAGGRPPRLQFTRESMRAGVGLKFRDATGLPANASDRLPVREYPRRPGVTGAHCCTGFMRSAVVLIVFNRPEAAARVLARIAEARPPVLFLIADGPRPNRTDDLSQCAATRQVVERVDWKCEVVRDFAEVNLGCGLRPASGITRVFEQVEEAVILEDDCVPHPTFFRFCDELLERYSNDERAMAVSGNNYLRDPHFEYSYAFHRYLNTHGWATWRRAWRNYDSQLSSWRGIRQGDALENLLGDARHCAFWRQIFDRTYARSGRLDVWDYQWHYAIMCNGGFGIAPAVNLVSHVHTKQRGTHMSGGHPLMDIPEKPMSFPLRHPPEVAWDQDYDRRVFDLVFLAPDLPPAPLTQRWRRAAAETIPLEVKRWIFNRRHSRK